MRIFELQWQDGEREWIAANTSIEAISYYLNLMSEGIDFLEDADEIIELPREKWDGMTVTNPDFDEHIPGYDWHVMTFADYMQDVSAPEIIAGTMYE